MILGGCEVNMVSKFSSRLSFFLICLPLLFFIWTCSGGGGGSTGGPLAGVIGDFCINTDNSQYTVRDGSGTQSFDIAQEPFFANFAGNIGGQVRAVTSATISQEDAQPVTVLLWGAGSSIRSGYSGAVLSSVPLKNEGVITDMAQYGTASKPKIVYGTERGIGIGGASAEGEESESFFKQIPSGVLSVASVKDGSKTNFLLTTGSGYILTTAEDVIKGGSGCLGILAAPSSFVESDVNFYPVKATIAAAKILVLANKSVAGGFTPTFAQAFDPILDGLINDTQPSIAWAIDTGAKSIAKVAFPASTSGFSGYDRFVPTDVATDGTNLYVAGLAYQKEAIDSFVISTCNKPSPDEKLTCMRNAAKAGTLISVKTTSGIDAIASGFFIYRDLSKTSEAAAFFARVPVSAFTKSEDAPSLIFHMAVSGDNVTFRGPNFLATLSKTTDTSGEESWRIDHAFDGRSGLQSGIPANLHVYADEGGPAIAATFVGVKNDDGSGASSLETMASDGTFMILDTGAIKTRMAAGAGSYIVGIELQNQRGGSLYIENPTERKWINFDSNPLSYASHAAYDGTALAYAWSRPGRGWTIAWQKGDDMMTTGSYYISFTGESLPHYDSFPDVSAGDTEALEQTRDIADMALVKGKLFVLYYGFYEGKHYYQVGVYGASVDAEGKYSVEHQGISSNTLVVSGDEADRRARFQKITKNDGTGAFTALFSCAAGLKQFQITPSSAVTVPAAPITSLFSASNVMDLDMDDAGQVFAFISNMTIVIRNLSDPTRNISSSSLPGSDTTTTRLSNSSIVLTSNRIFIATPQGAAAPFWILASPQTPTIKSKCASCYFNGLATFPAFANQLLVSSDTGGIEIYDIEGL